MELEGLYHDVVEASADGIWVFDLAGRTLYANPALAAMFGTGRDEFRELTVFDTLDPAGQVQFAEHLEMIRRGHVNEHDVEVNFVRGDGTSFWALVAESVLHTADGEIRGVLHRFADFDERRRVVDAITESRQQLAEGQRIARIGTWEWHVATDQIHGSEGLTAIYGLQPDYFPAGYGDVLDSVHPDDRAEVEQAVDGALAGADEFLFQARIMGADDWIWTRGRGVVRRDAAGEILTVTGTFQDITETKQAEVALQDQVTQNQLMQAIATAANEARTLEDVLVHARSLVLLHDDWSRGRGFVVSDDGTDLLPFHLHDADRRDDEATPEESAMELTLARRALREKATVWDDQRLTIAFPVRYAGDVYAVLTITSDPPLYRHEMIQAMVEQVAVQLGRVVERQQAERALADARDGAMEASRQKSEFLATMSHEIRTPLNGVIGLNDLLLRSRLDADQLRLASGVQAAGRSLLGLINDILDFSKIEAGKLELENLDFDVRSVFDQVANMLGEAARAKGLDLLVSCDDSVPAMLAGDPTRLAQVVTNLGSNAVKFTDAGEVVVRASATIVDGRTVLRVDVTDTGIGLDPDDAEELFDSFTQGDASTTRVHGGTGLGLAISREIVRALDGEIGVDSVPGRGSEFWFTASFAPSSGSDESPEDQYARTWLAGRRVLVVDDHEQHRAVLAGQLSWWGLRPDGVASASGAERAIADAVTAGDPFEAVLVDRTLALPRRNGLHLVRSLRRDPAYDELTLLVLSSTTDLDTAAARGQGIADCLTKPVLGRILRAALLEHLAGVDVHAVTPDQPGQRPGVRRRILVVEDNTVNQMVAVGLLDALGYDADTADDGLAALDAFDPGRHDAVLMDVQMPRLDGYAATRAIRERESGRRVPVLAMTAAAVEGERERCLAAGMDDFLTKPVDPDALAAALSQWVSGEPATVRTGARPVPPPAVDGADLDVSRLDMLRDMAPGNTTYLDRAIGNFVANTPVLLATITEAVAAGDAERLRQAAHRLSGSASNLGVAWVSTIARELELVADGGTTEGAAALLPVLAEGFDRGRVSLLDYQTAYAGPAA